MFCIFAPCIPLFGTQKHSPRVQVDYLSPQQWEQESDVWTSWKAMTKNKEAVEDGLRCVGDRPFFSLYVSLGPLFMLTDLETGSRTLAGERGRNRGITSRRSVPKRSTGELFISFGSLLD
jgi:hypothetical protein